MSEPAFLHRLKAGDISAFQELVELHRDRVLNACYRFVPDRSDAEDLTQEVFLAAYQAVEHFRGEAKLSTWLYRIAVTKCLDFIRKSKRQKRIGLLHWISPSGGGPRVAEPADKPEDPPAAQPDPETYTGRREQLDVLLAALDSLAENQRIAFTLSKCEGLSGLEIAEVMGTSVSAVESLIHRARKNLEKYLYGHYEKKQ